MGPLHNTEDSHYFVVCSLERSDVRRLIPVSDGTPGYQIIRQQPMIAALLTCPYNFIWFMSLGERLYYAPQTWHTKYE